MLAPESLAPKQAITSIFSDASKSFASVAGGNGLTTVAEVIKGRKKMY